MKKILVIFLIITSSYLFADLKFGKSLFNDGLYEEAIKEFEKVIAYSPTSDDAKEAIFYIAESYRESKQFTEAELTYNRLLEGFPGLLFRDKVLYYLAQTQIKNDDNYIASENLKLLINTYPNSNFSKMALSQYLQSLFNQVMYDDIIIEGRKIIRNYKDYHNLPDVLLWIAKARFKLQMPEEGKRLLKQIIDEYPQHLTRWEAMQLRIKIIEKEDGIEKAAQALAEILKVEIPRNYEEIFRSELADYYITLKDYSKAYLDLGSMINKYSSSLKLDEYILQYTYTQLKLKKYTEIIKDHKRFNKVFRESDKQSEYLLKIAEANYLINDLVSAQDWLNKITVSEGETLYKKQLLNADILKASGKYTQAVNEYKKLLNNDYASKPALLLILGNIYYSKFQQYTTAKKYYQWVLAEYSSKDLQDIAVYKIALCFENLEDYNSAISELEQIDIDQVKDTDLKKEILKKLDYLKKYKDRDYEAAFDNLITTFLKNSDEVLVKEIKDDLLKILINDLHDYEMAIRFLNDGESEQNNYKRAILWLKVAEKYIYESESLKADESLMKVEKISAKITNRSWLDEIQIRKQILQNSQPDPELITRIDTFIKSNKNSSAANVFRLYLGKYFTEKNDIDSAVKYYTELVNNSEIDNTEFYKAKIILAEYFYSNNDDAKALENYKTAQAYIKINDPIVYFHYAVVLNELGYEEEAKNKLSFLLNNVSDFDEYSQVVRYFTNSLRESEDYANAVKFQLLTPARDRNDDFYRILASDYEKLNNNLDAKEALMHVIEKTQNDLEKLANLQFVTDDLEMAKYTYKELLKQNKNNYQYYEMLGRINFIQENYLEAAVNYKKIVDKYEDNASAYKNIGIVAKENIIALYRIENRPKAEKLAKIFKDQLDQKAKYEIELNRGIYYKKIDKKKATKIFSKLLKKKDLTTEIMIKAYFWRGVAYMENEKLEEAEQDFSTVANSIDKSMSNQAHLKLGTINFSQENYQKALSHYYKVIEQDEDGKLAFAAASNFALVCKTMKEWQKAIAAYQIILERWGDEGLEAKTIFDIAFCYFRDKKYSHAIDMFRRAIPLLENKEAKAEAQYWIGESLFGMEKYESAVSELLKVGYNYSEFTQWAASAELKAGEAYQNNKQFDKAAQIYERVIDKYGKYSQWGTEASSRLLIMDK